MRQRGLVKGGTEGCAIIGFGDRWREPDKVRFFDDEPVRHKMLDLIVSSCCYTAHLQSLSMLLSCCCTCQFSVAASLMTFPATHMQKCVVKQLAYCLQGHCEYLYDALCPLCGSKTACSFPNSDCLHVVQGDLSLLADKGHAGIPLGHIIAYKADHALHVEFAQALKASKNAA